MSSQAFSRGESDSGVDLAQKDRIGRASILLASGTVVSRGLGFIRSIVLAGTIGVVGSASADAFAVANGLPNTVYAIVAGGVLTAVLVPQIVRAMRPGGGGEAFINKLLTLAMTVIFAATLVATLSAPLLSWLYASSNPKILPLAIAFAWWCLPQIFFYGLFSLLAEVLNARRQFGPASWAPVMNNIVSILGLVAFGVIYGFDASGLRSVGDWNPLMISIVGGTATLGIVLQVVMLAWFWRRAGLRFRPDFSWRGVGLGAPAKQAGWTFGMVLLTTLAGIVHSQVLLVASGHGASIAAYDTAWLVYILPQSVVALSIATAYFTRMSEHAAESKFELLLIDVRRASRTIAVIITFAGATLIAGAYPIAAVFQPGKLSGVSGLGNVIAVMAFGLLAYSMLYVVQRAFNAMGDTRTPFFYTLAQTVVFSAGALVCLMLPPTAIAVGVGAFATLATFVQFTLGVVLLRRRLGPLGSRSVVQSIVKNLIAAVPAALIGIIVAGSLGAYRDGGFAISSRAGGIVALIIVGVSMGLTYITGLILIRSPEIKGVLSGVAARRKSRRSI